MTPLRIGAVSFLNARPLVYGLQDGPDYVLNFDAPSVLAEKLRLGEIDVGLVPTVEFLRGVGDAIIPGIGIASEGPVRTVKLFSRVPLEELQIVAVDGRSRTSVAMLRILLAERFGVTPDFYSFRADLGEMLRVHQAALLIGDAAFTDSGAPRVWDLGKAWTELTGLPFVYAAWTLRQGSDRERVEPWLRAALNDGLTHLADIAREAAGSHGQDEAALLAYLRDHLHYVLGERDKKSIELFRTYCVRYNLIPSNKPARAGVEVHP